MHQAACFSSLWQAMFAAVILDCLTQDQDQKRRRSKVDLKGRKAKVFLVVTRVSSSQWSQAMDADALCQIFCFGFRVRSPSIVLHTWVKPVEVIWSLIFEQFQLFETLPCPVFFAPLPFETEPMRVGECLNFVVFLSVVHANENVFFFFFCAVQGRWLDPTPFLTSSRSFRCWTRLLI